jgi:hypothetical protein
VRFQHRAVPCAAEVLYGPADLVAEDVRLGGVRNDG